jgi:hypothetical protein
MQKSVCPSREIVLLKQHYYAWLTTDLRVVSVFGVDA